MISIGHASDIHLSPLPSFSFSALLNKRLIGWSAWHFNRRHEHIRMIADCLRDDIGCSGVDHVVLTGDLVNIALPQEFDFVDDWLSGFASCDWLSIVPGNHDAYVRPSSGLGFMTWRRYMEGDIHLRGILPNSCGNREDSDFNFPDMGSFFPFVRRRGNIALIGLSSAVPSAPFIACGEIGSAQLKSLSIILSHLYERGFFRIILIHHPPLPGMARWRHDLRDARALRDILYDHGAELVLHGHLHRLTHHYMRTRNGGVHIIGMPSGSSCGRPRRHRDSSYWARYDIDRSSRLWRCHMHLRRWDISERRFTSYESKDLDWL